MVGGAAMAIRRHHPHLLRRLRVAVLEHAGGAEARAPAIPYGPARSDRAQRIEARFRPVAEVA
jgi:hypothetical protein